MPYLQLWLTSCSCLALFVRMRLEARSHAQVICHDFVGFLAGNFQLVALLDETQFGSRVGSAMQILPIHLVFGVFLHRLCLAIFVQLGFWCDFGRCRYFGLWLLSGWFLHCPCFKCFLHQLGLVGDLRCSRLLGLQFCESYLGPPTIM